MYFDEHRCLSLFGVIMADGMVCIDNAVDKLQVCNKQRLVSFFFLLKRGNHMNLHYSF